MGKPRIYVLHIRQILKASAVVVIGLLVLITIIYYFTREDANLSAQGNLNTQQTFIPGTYRAKIYLSYKPVFVEVTVSEDEIMSVALNPLTENQEIFYPLLMPTMNIISQEILEKQNLNVTISYENKTTSHILVSAVYRALDEATY